MSDFIIKGTVVGFTVENWIADLKLFSSTLITVMNTWSDNETTIDGEVLNARHKLLKASYGEVKQAVIALDNDIHNLSVCYNQIIRDLKDENLKGGMRSLFIGNLVENYFTNLRSIYDHMATFPRIVCDESYLKQGLLKTTSFNNLLSLIDKHGKIQIATSEGIVWAIDQCRENFEVIKALRDAIIHLYPFFFYIENSTATSKFAAMIKFPVIQQNMSTNNFLLFGSRPYACYNKFTSTETSKKLGFLTENTIFFVMQGTKVFYFKDYEIKVDGSHGVLLKKGIYPMAEFVTENQCFEALMIFVPDHFLRQFRDVGVRPTSGNDVHPYATIFPNELLEGFRIQYLSYFGKSISYLEEILQLKLKELFLLLMASSNKGAVNSFIETLTTSGATDIDYILKSHLLQPLTISEIAVLSGRSLASFKRDFQEKYNIPPKQWINRQRLNHSYRELKNTSKQVSEVAFECGFESPSHFIKIFKKEYGITPNSLRAEKPTI